MMSFHVHRPSETVVAARAESTSLAVRLLSKVLSCAAAVTYDTIEDCLSFNMVRALRVQLVSLARPTLRQLAGCHLLCRQHLSLI